MYYFVNEYILQKNSSVEHTAMKRVKLFNHYKQPAKIITKIYDQLLHQTIGQFGISDDEVLNMFDYFQGTTQKATAKVLTTDDMNLPIEYEVVVGANFSRVFNGDRLVENVGFIPGTVGRVFYQEFFDQLGNHIGTDLWDWRGFKSSTQYFGQDGQLIVQHYYAIDGTTKLVEYFSKDTNGNPLPARIILKDYLNRGDVFFQNPDELFAFFLKEIGKRDGEATFIVDRPGTGVKPLLALDDASRKYIYVPINHAVKPNDPIHAELDGFLEPAFEHFSHFNGFITGTMQQTKHLLARYPKANIFSIPATTTLPLSKEQAEKIEMDQRQQHSLIYVGRIAPDKQIDQQLRMFALVKARIPDATLTLFGYGDSKYITSMQDLVKELKLTDAVAFKDYVADLTDQYDQYQVMTNMSLADGGPLAIQEAFVHGTPVVSYRFNYGPEDYIDDGENGFLIDPGQSLTMAEKIIDLFQDNDKLQNFSEAAYVKAHTKWTRRKVWNQWQKELQI